MKIKKVFFIIVIIIMAFSFLSMASLYYKLTRPPSVEPGSYLVLEVSGEINEVYQPGFPMSLFVEERLSFHGILENIRKAEVDDRIEGIILNVGPSSLGIARIQELRQALVRFREAGKTVVSYTEFGTDLDYYLATAAETVYLHPVTLLFVDGIAARLLFLRGTLDKLGLEPEFVQVGEYKNAPDQLTRKSMTGTQREAETALIESLFTGYLEDIAAARGMTPGAMRRVLDRGYFTSREARAEGLVDSLAYWDQVKEPAKAGNGYRTIDGLTYARIEPSSLGLEDGPTVAVIYVTGNIVTGGGGPSRDESFTNSEAVRHSFEKVRLDDDVRAVILRVNSPGGVSSSAETIWREIVLAREEKPVIASMSDYAASGGYYIASACDAVVANPGTITGSIGAFSGKINMLGLYEKLGMNPEMITIGKNSALLFETTSFTEEQREKIREDMLDFYMQDFVKKVADARGLSPDSVDALGRGRVWSGSQAVRSGLVDQSGTLHDAVSVAKELAGIDVEQDVDLVVYPRPRKFIERLFDIEIESRAGLRGVPAVLDETYEDLVMWERLMAGGRLFYLMPFELELE